MKGTVAVRGDHRAVLVSLGLAVAAAAALLTVGPALAGKAAHKRASATVRISTRVVPGLGRILVDSRGRTLYMFVPDKRKRVTCVKTCAALWPPIMVAKNAKVVGSHGVKAKLLGSDPDPAGGRVATYDGWPLYLYAADVKAGMATGQALNLNGGLWYVVAPSGKVIKTKPVPITTAVVHGLGRILVDYQGRTLYMFVPDKRKRVTCVKTCAAVWPPVKLTKNEAPAALGSVKAKLLGSDPNPAGGRVITYHGWPLYYYAADTKPGMATGQALNLNGGLWYVIAPSGKLIKTNLTSSASSTSQPASSSSGSTPAYATTTTTTTTTTTSPAMTTTTTAPPPATTTTPAPAANDGCPAGITIQTSGATDDDSDENGAPSDGDGCT